MSKSVINIQYNEEEVFVGVVEVFVCPMSIRKSDQMILLSPILGKLDENALGRPGHLQSK